MKKILLVDDERSILLLVESFLTSMGYEVVSFQSSQQAAWYLDEKSVDLVLTDFSMPGISGAVLAELAKKREIQVIIMTGKPWNLPANHLADKIINKPFDLSNLAQTIADLIDFEIGGKNEI